NLDSSSPYFNSGLLLMNIKKWLEYDVTPKVIDCVNQNRDVASFSDQYGLNVVLANKWLELDPLWNYYSNGNLSFPYLIHFFHRKPFYKTYPYNEAYQKLFYEYLDKTAWKGTKPVGELKRYFIKIGNVVNKIPLLFKKKNHTS
ncbi:glycosyltransferase family 8 protein, partial [Pseudoxanthomonas sp. SGD-10]